MRMIRRPPVVGILLCIISSLSSSHLCTIDSPEIGPGELIGASSSSSSAPTGSTTQAPPAAGFPASTTPASNPPTASSSGSGRSKTGAIVGGAVGAAVALLVIAIVIFGIVYLRWRQRTNSGARGEMAEDATIASPPMSDPPLTSTSRRFSVRAFLPSYCICACSCHLFLVLSRIRPTRPRACCFLRCRQPRGSQTSPHRWFLDHTRDPGAH